MPALSLLDLENFDPHSRGAAAGERRFLCPLCGQDKPRDSAHRSLSLNPATGAYFCHRCGEKGVVVEKRDEKPRDPRSRGRDELRRKFAVPVTPPPSPAAAVPSPALPDAPKEAPFDWRAAWDEALPVRGTVGETYLAGRGISAEVAEAADVRFSPRWWGAAAVLFPIQQFELRAQPVLVAVQGRYLNTGKGPKMRTGGPKKDGAFVTQNGYWEGLKRGAPLIICEAPIDALSLAQCGFPALALCGKDGVSSWLPVRSAFNRVALAFDADEAGDSGAAKLGQQLESLAAKPLRLTPEGAKDWNEMLLKLGPEHLADWLAARVL